MQLSKEKKIFCLAALLSSPDNGRIAAVNFICLASHGYSWDVTGFVRPFTLD